VANTLAYYETSKNTAIKCFVVLAPGAYYKELQRESTVKIMSGSKIGSSNVFPLDLVKQVMSNLVKYFVVVSYSFEF
jgi:hypothetical protein